MKRQLLRDIGALLGLALVLAVLSALFHPRRPGWNAESLRDGETRLETVLRWKQPVLWVDARLAKEYDQGHVPGAMLLNEDEWEELLEAILEQWRQAPAETRWVVYCADAGCGASRRVAERLRAAGLERVYVLQGGWQLLKEAGLEIEFETTHESKAAR